MISKDTCQWLATIGRLRHFQSWQRRVMSTSQIVIGIARDVSVLNDESYGILGPMTRVTGWRRMALEHSVTLQAAELDRRLDGLGD